MNNRLAGIHKIALALLAYVVVGAVLAYAMRGLRFDDPFITYRYAENLATGQGFSFNPGEATLITTAPLYALILAALRVTGADIPQASYLIGAAGLISAASILFLFGRRHAHTAGGWMAGLFLLVFPLAWLTIGFETPLFLACALLTFILIDAGKVNSAGLLAGVVIGLRGDGMIVLLIAAIFSIGPGLAGIGYGDWRVAGWRLETFKTLTRLLPKPARVCLLALAVYAPLAIWLTMRFGNPVPTTLLTKSAQAVSGLTGFYPFTSFLSGGWLLIQALVAQSPGILCVLALAVAGLLISVQVGYRGLLMPVLWGMAHLVGYGLLGVAPYVWYYTPVVPGLALLVAFGIEVVARRLVHDPSRQILAQAGLALVCAGSLLAPISAIVVVLAGGAPPAPADLRAKLLPETKVDVYAQVGQWVHDHTPADATFGVTELGVMSYYAQRHSIDFLGLVQPQYLAAIRHGDYLQTLVREQPGYVALSSVNAIYDFDPQGATWFNAIYKPVEIFPDARYWGSPMVLYQRQAARIAITLTLDAGVHDLGDGWQITGIRASSRSASAGMPLFLRLQLTAGQPVGNRTLSVQPVLIEGGDGLPVSSRLVFTSQWHVGESDWLDFPLVPQASARKGGYVVAANWLEGGPTLRAGTIKVPLDPVPQPDTTLAPLSQGVGVWHLAQPIVLCAGTAATLTLFWRGGALGMKDLTAFVQVRNGDKVVAQADAPPHHGAYPTSVWSPGEVVPDEHTIEVGDNVASGLYPVVVGLYNPSDNTRLPVDVSPDRTPDGGVQVGQVEVKACERSTK